MTKILFLSDNGIPSGYGRIADNICTRLVKRGYDVIAASLFFDGLLPPQYEGERLPYWVASLAGKNWLEETLKLIPTVQPDVIVVAQDFPYAEQLYHAPVDWSKTALVVITPVDGAPIYPKWVDVAKQVDGLLTISKFGVETFRRAGVQATLCPPGVDGNKFFKHNDETRAALRTKLGLSPDHFLAMTAAQNQGRKCYSLMLQAFFDFAADKPNARYLIDAEATSPAGWDIPALCQQFGWDTGKIIFRADAVRAGIIELRDRYNCADLHMVVSHREGFGLPLVEAQACGVASMALDYCSGGEICGYDEETGQPRGYLLTPSEHTEAGTWGGALDRSPDMKGFVNRLQWAHDHADERNAIAQRGMEWARKRHWDDAADATQKVIEQVIAKRRAIPPATIPMTTLIAPPIPPLPQSLDGVSMALVEG